MKSIIIVFIGLLLFCNTAIADDWRVTWEPIKESIIDKEYGIAIQNLQDVKRDVNISSFFAETDFEISKLTDIKFYEWKNIPYTYEVNHYDEIEYTNYITINNTWNNYTESVFNYTEIVESEKLDWKKCKMQVFKEDSKSKENNYGFINIPAYGSKLKDDGTYNGTKFFKLTFKTPIVYNDTYGSNGKFAVLLDGIEHHPYWDTSWSTRKEIILTGNTSGAQTDYQLLLNISYESEMQPDFDDLRFCNNTDEIDSWLEFKVDGSYALIWVEFPTTPANGVNQTYYMYFGNAGAASDWDGVATFVHYDGFEDGDSSDAGDFIELSTNWASATHAHSGTYGLGVVGSTAQNSQSMGSLALNSVVCGVWIYTQDTTNRLGTTYVKDSNAVTGVMVKFDAGKIYALHNDVWADTGKTYGVGEWHLLEMRLVSASSYYISIDHAAEQNYNGLAAWSAINIDYISFSSDDVVCYRDDFLVRKYAANPPTYIYGSKSYYTDSIHYNTNNSYNNTIQSDGTIIINRTITQSDKVGWTASALTDDCHLVISKYDLSNTIIANFTIYTASLDWLTVTGLSPYTNYSLLFTNGTLIESHESSNIDTVYFISDLTTGSYIISQKMVCHPLIGSAYQFYDEMEAGLTDFRDNMSRYLVWGIIFFAVGLAFTIFAKIKTTLVGNK